MKTCNAPVQTRLSAFYRDRGLTKVDGQIAFTGETVGDRIDIIRPGSIGAPEDAELESNDLSIIRLQSHLKFKIAGGRFED